MERRGLEKIVAGLAITLMCAFALYARIARPYSTVFQPGFVNFLGGDAWFHVRVEENLAHHFPWRMEFDPYGSFDGQDVPTGPFLDWVVDLTAFAIARGTPSEQMLHHVAAWCPAILGMLIVPAVFFLGRLVFGTRAGLIAAAIAATLPGQFRLVSSLGFTDHHVMEALLATLILAVVAWMEEKPASLIRSVCAGLLLAAYGLTWTGGASLIVIIALWGAYEIARQLGAADHPAPSMLPLVCALAIAAVLMLPFHHRVWMRFNLPATLAAAIGLFLLEKWRDRCRVMAHPWAAFFGGSGAVALGLLAVITLIRPSALSVAWRNVSPLMPGRGQDVMEMRHQGLMTLWGEFGAPILFAAPMLIALIVAGIRRKTSAAADLLMVFGVTMLMAALIHVRFNYYLAIAVAVLGGGAAARVPALIRTGTRWSAQWALATALMLLMLGPNSLYSLIGPPELYEVAPAWRQALEWLRSNTPEPFANPDAYYDWHPARGDAGWHYTYPPEAYSIMTWWDYGYWIEAIARRIPVANATQHNAQLAADFFLAQSEEEGLAILKRTRSRYVVFDYRLPIIGDRFDAGGQFWALFNYASHAKREDYLLDLWNPTNTGLRRQTFYLPAFYRTILWRMYVAKGARIEHGLGAAIVTFKEDHSERAVRKILTDLRPADENASSHDGMLVGEDPLTSAVPIEPLTHLRTELANGQVWIYSVQDTSR